VPIYEYRCRDCGARSSFLVGVTAEKVSIACDRCGSAKMDKLVSRCMYVMSEETRMEKMLDPSKLGDLDENDPRSVARWAKRFGSHLGEDMGEDFDSMMEELESGKMPSEEGAEPEEPGGEFG
jgi:putative FmdB family regulatory protein